MTTFRLGLMLALLCLPVSVFAQWGNVGMAQTTVNATVGGVGLDATQLGATMRPTQVFCLVEDGDIRWTVDGTAPTTTVGYFAAADTALPAISGSTLLTEFRAIRATGTNALLTCTYFAGGSLPFREWGGTTATAAGGGGGGVGLTDAELRASAVPMSLASVPSHVVTGTFWQATQPVSGTFWQATQPVSGTFWQATQPISGTIQPGNTPNTTAWLFTGGLSHNGVAAGANRLATLPGVVETSAPTNTVGRNVGFSFFTGGGARMTIVNEAGAAQALAADGTHDSPAPATGPVVQGECDDTSTDAIDEADGGRLRIDCTTRALYVRPDGTTLKRYISAGSTEDESQVKATAGVLLGVSARNAHATTDAYLKCTNLTAANTTPGSSTIFYEMIVPPGGGFADRQINATFDTALTCYIVTGKADNDATEVAASDVSYNLTYK